MSAQLNFDLQAGIEARDLGVRRVIYHNREFIKIAREHARMYCRTHGSVTSDDVRQVLDRYGIYPIHENAYGAIFRGKEWVCVGMTNSKIKSNHGRMIRRWDLRPCHSN